MILLRVEPIQDMACILRCISAAFLSEKTIDSTRLTFSK